MDVDVLMLGVKVAQHLVQELKQFKRGFVVEFNQGEVAHERWAVEAINDLLDFGGRKIRSF